MSRGQATVEYVTLVAVLLIGACLLVRFQTPVQTLAEAVAHAVATPHRRAPRGPRPHRARRPVTTPRRPVVHHCLCPRQPAPTRTGARAIGSG